MARCQLPEIMVGIGEKVIIGLSIEAMALRLGAKKMKHVDVTTTATLRPEILGKTYSSFRTNLLKPGLAKYRCVLNVDPIGEDISSEEVIKVAKAFFPHIVNNVPETPNFSMALRWCWEHTEAEYIFNLEDDWEMMKPLDLIDMLNIMDEHPNLAHLRLSMFPTKTLPEGSLKGSGLCLRQWNRYIPWNGRFFEVPREKIFQLGYSGNPSLMRGEFVRSIAQFFHPRLCPEKTLKGGFDSIRREISKWRFGAYHEFKDKAPRTIRDHGRQWREKHDFYKDRNMYFSTWERIPFDRWPRK